MNKNILRQYIHMVKEKEETEARIRRIEEKLERLNKEGNVIDTVRGGVGNQRIYKVEGFPVADEDELKYNLNKQRRILIDRIHSLEDKTTELEKWLNELSKTDSRMSRLITKHYIEGKEWHKVATEMGKAYTADSCRMNVSRFLEEN